MTTLQKPTKETKAAQPLTSFLFVPFVCFCSNSPLEQPWTLPPEDFARRAPRADPKQFTAARDETAALTAQIEKLEREIDARVAALYGL